MAVEHPTAAVEDVAPWPGILTRPRRALRTAADRRSWIGPLLASVATAIAAWALRSMTGAPPPGHPPVTGHWLGDYALGLGVLVVAIVLIPFGLGRLVGGRATLTEVVIVLLWSQLPAVLVRLPLETCGRMLLGPAWWSMEGSLAQPSALFALPPAAIVLIVIEEVVAFWCLGLNVVGLSEVHRVPATRIVLLIVLPLFVLGVIAAIAAAVLVASLSAPGG